MSSSNLGLINYLKQKNRINYDLTYETMIAVDRKNFMIHEDDSYYDSPSSIGYNVTISAPHMHATALDLFNDVLVKREERKLRILDVGCGSGYLLACFGAAIENYNGIVFGLEIQDPLIKFALDNLKKEKRFGNMIENKVIQVVKGDGWEGLEKEAPFDIIHVGASANSIPSNLVKQLNKEGIMVIPVGSDYLLVRKDKNGVVTKKSIFGVRFVPLINPKNLK